MPSCFAGQLLLMHDEQAVVRVVLYSRTETLNRPKETEDSQIPLVFKARISKRYLRPKQAF